MVAVGFKIEETALGDMCAESCPKAQRERGHVAPDNPISLNLGNTTTRENCVTYILWVSLPPR